MADALLNNAAPDTNFGASGSISDGEASGVQRDSLLRFDLSTLPPHARITSATATLTVLFSAGTAETSRAHRALAPWVESAVTWNSFNGAYDPVVEGTFPLGSPTSADLTILVQGWLNGRFPNYGLLLERQLDGGTVFGTSEDAQALRPRLAVCYLADQCAGQVDGTSCNDGNACTRTDACLASVCTGSQPVVCASHDQCHVAGTCDPATGACADPTMDDGTTCDDADPTTAGDVCTSGVCAGFRAVSVPAGGEIDLAPGSYGVVTVPQNAILRLTGGNYNIFSISLASGAHILAEGSSVLQISTTLVAGAGSVIRPDPALGVPLNLRIEADGVDVAVSIGQGASVSAIILAPIGTIQVGDNAVITGTVNGFFVILGQNVTYPLNATGYLDPACSTPCQGPPRCAYNRCTCTPLPLGAKCQDGDVCHTSTCQAAGCVASSKPDGTVCTDHNPCTLADRCHGGACIGGAPMVCPPQDQCHTATCDSTTGGCLNFAAVDGIACNDGNFCTSGDACSAGICLGDAEAMNGAACAPTRDATGQTCQYGICAGSVSCVAYSNTSLAPPSNPAPTVPVGTIPGAFSVTSTGEATYTMPLVVPPGRVGMEPQLSLVYSSAGDDGVLGMGFSIAGLSVITRCPQNKTQDGAIREVLYDVLDNFCLDGRRLVLTRVTSDGREYRTLPDTFTRVLSHSSANWAPANGPEYFEVFTRSGLVVEYGHENTGKAMANNGSVRAWWITQSSDRRGNTVAYLYQNNKDPDHHTIEQAVSEIHYTGNTETGDLPKRAVFFDYDAKASGDIRTLFTRGMRVTSSLRLAKIRTQGPDGAAVRAYVFGYGQGPVTGRTILQQVSECTRDGAPGTVCMPPTRFQYSGGQVGFQATNTGIQVPYSNLASPMLLDVTGDGLDDLVIPDMTAINAAITAGNAGIVTTDRHLAINAGPLLGPVFWPAAPTPLQTTWPVGTPFTDVQLAAFMADPRRVQPELGTAVDYDQDGRMDIFLHDVDGAFPTWFVLLARPDHTFQLHNTGVLRPGAAFATPVAGVSTREGSAHLADVDGNGVPDLIQCENNINGAPPHDYTWKLHLWKPGGGGWDLKGTSIDALHGYPCDTSLVTVDVNGDGTVDLIVQEANQDDVGNILYLSTYVALSWDGWTWKGSPMTGLPVNAPLFLDVNGDGLPDAIELLEDDQLHTFINTGNGFATPVLSLSSLILGDVRHLFQFAQTIDYNGDGLRDILVPLPNGTAALPSWTVLQSTGSVTGPTFTIVDPQIPFEASLGQDLTTPSTTSITLADPRGPRIGDLDGDGAQDVLLALNQQYIVFRSRAGDEDLLVGVSDGLNTHAPATSGYVPNVAVAYTHLTDTSITDGVPLGAATEGLHYLSRADAANHCDYPRYCVVGSRRVVRGYALNNGADQPRSFDVVYRDGRYHREGLGFLGFGERIVRDLDTNGGTADFYDNITTITYLHHVLGNSFTNVEVFPYAGQVVKELRFNPGLATQPIPGLIELSFTNVTLETDLTYGGTTYFTLPTQHHVRREQGFHVNVATTIEEYVTGVEATNGADMMMNTYATVFAHDNYGNVLAENTQTQDLNEAASVTRTFSNDVGRWLIGQLSTQTEQSIVGTVTQSRTTSRAYDDAGDLYQTTTASDDPDPVAQAQTALSLVLSRDVYGNVIGTSSTDAYGDVRDSCTTYDAEHLFPYARVNAAGHVSYMAVDPGLGVPTAVIDPNGLVTTRAYDGFGRLAQEHRPDSTMTTYTLSAVSTGQHGVMALETKTSGGADDTVQYDSRGRPIRWFSVAPQIASAVTCIGPNCVPSRIMQEIAFDDLGENVASRSVPDAEFLPVGQRKYDRYDYDSLGRVVTHTTPWNATYQYGYFDNDAIVTDPLGATTTVHHDALSRTVGVVDANNHTTSYAYGTFGGLQVVTNPGGSLTTMERDAYGRVTRLSDPDRGITVSTYNGFGELRTSTDALQQQLQKHTTFSYDVLGRTRARTDQDGTTQWKWDQVYKGRLDEIDSPAGHTEMFAYDPQTRLQTKALGIVGPSGTSGTTTLSSTFTYDLSGRLWTVSYPADSETAASFEVVNDYDNYGHLLDVKDASTDLLYWQLTGVDGAGRPQTEVFGDLTTTVRSYYPDMNRVKSIVTTSANALAPLQSLAYDYDLKLNVADRADVVHGNLQHFGYDPLDRLTCVSATPGGSCELSSYSYDPNGNIKSKSNVGTYQYNDPLHPHAVTGTGVDGAGSYVYDAVGNQVTRPSGAVTYTAFDLPKTVGGAELAYDGEQQRIRKTTSEEETLYFGGLYERVTNNASAVEHRFYVHSGERAVAVVTRTAGSTDQVSYLHPDNLGSTDTVSGDKTESRSYDPFGARQAAGWQPAVMSSYAPATTRGFTGHESDEELGLVNMKGRVYDPKIGRFLTPDPVVSAPHDGQSWNAYSYVQNNPLAYVDPSGFQAADADGCGEACRALKTGTVATVSDGGKTRQTVTTTGPPPKPEPDQGGALGAGPAPTNVETLGSSSGQTSQQQQSRPSLPALPGLPSWETVKDTTLKGGWWYVTNAPFGVGPAIQIYWGAGKPTNSVPVVIITSLKAVPVLGNAVYVGEDAGKLYYGRMSMSTEDKVLLSVDLAAHAVGLVAGAAGIVGAPAGQGAAASTFKDRVLNSATKELNGKGLTAVGRALQKHADRPGSWLANYGSLKNPVARTAAGRELIEQVFDADTVSKSVHPVHGDVVRVRLPDGSGIWFTAAGDFIGFLERYTSR